jgi:2-oxoglutarate dehydrogenase E1 component
MTPKSLLRHPQAASRLEELAEGSWRPVFDDPWATDERASRVTRLVFCSGKLFYELVAEAEKLGDERPALIRLEQLYSFPWPECRLVLARYPRAQRLIWAQEEPRNMGAWTYLEPKLRELLPQGAELRYVGRPERASPAEGYPAAHLAEQSRIVGDALGIKQPRLSRETVVTAGEGQG